MCLSEIPSVNCQPWNILSPKTVMVFSFNFGAAAPNEEQKKEESLGDEKPSDISWRKAEEIFLDDTHLCALGWTNILGVELA